MHPATARALIVHHDEDIRQAVTRALARVTSHRVYVHAASSVPDARRAFHAGAFDLIVAGTRVADGGGADLLALAARERPETRRVLITPHQGAGVGLEVIQQARADAMVRWPLDEASFAALAERLLAPSQPKLDPRAPAAPKPEGKAAVELRGIEQELGRLKVRLALGTLTSEDYAVMSRELVRKRADLQARAGART